MYEELREINNEIKRKQDYIDELRALATSMTMALGERVQTSPSDRLSNLMCKIIIAENELDSMIDDYADRKLKAKNEIFTLPNEEWQDIVYLHYIEYKSYPEIAQIKKTSLGAVQKKSQRAIKTLKKQLTST